MTCGGHYCTGYIDDFLLFSQKRDSSKAFDRLNSLLTELGFDISHDKTVTPSTKAISFSILVDTDTVSLSIPPEKVIEHWNFRKSCTKNQLQSLLGSLLYISKCVRHSRFFLNRLLHTLRTHNNKKLVS